MLQKAVDIHFDLNYRHLCVTSTDDSNTRTDNSKKDETKDGEKAAGAAEKEQEVLQSSLVDEMMQG